MSAAADSFTAAIPSVDPYFKRPYAPGAGFCFRLIAEGRDIEGTLIGARAWSPQFKPYVYRGSGRDELTPWIDDLPEWTWGERLSRRAERMQALAELNLWHGPGPVPPPGYITARQAAEQLGVDVRTVERYKRELERRPS